MATGEFDIGWAHLRRRVFKLLFRVLIEEAPKLLMNFINRQGRNP